MATAISAGDVEGTVFRSLAEMGTEGAAISREATFEELDIDSLDLVELAQVIEDEFGVLIEGEDVKALRTVGEAIDLVVARAR
jgi:acyl carrier protein